MDTFRLENVKKVDELFDRGRGDQVREMKYRYKTCIVYRNQLVSS